MQTSTVIPWLVSQVWKREEERERSETESERGEQKRGENGEINTCLGNRRSYLIFCIGLLDGCRSNLTGLSSLLLTSPILFIYIIFFINRPLHEMTCYRA